MDIFKKCFEYTAPQEVKQAGVYPYFHELQSKQHTEVMIRGKRVVMIGSNNYLGLTSDPRVVRGPGS